jgi:hypothetical protein
MVESFRSLRNFSIGGTNHKERIEHKKDNCSSLRPLRSLWSNLSFTLVAALPRWGYRDYGIVEELKVGSFATGTLSNARSLRTQPYTRLIHA